MRLLACSRHLSLRFCRCGSLLGNQHWSSGSQSRHAARPHAGITGLGQTFCNHGRLECDSAGPGELRVAWGGCDAFVVSSKQPTCITFTAARELDFMVISNHWRGPCSAHRLDTWRASPHVGVQFALPMEQPRVNIQVIKRPHQWPAACPFGPQRNRLPAPCIGTLGDTAERLV